MIDLTLLEQFATFADCGTLSGAAEQLHLTQPALSRNMKKLEETLGVALFARRKNRLALTETGQYVLTLARPLLAQAEALTQQAQRYDRQRRTISLGLCAPAPGWLITPALNSLFPDRLLETELAEEPQLLAGLANDTYQLIVLPHPVADCASVICGRETLSFALPRGHRFARRKSLTFAEMNGENMILMNNIGFWHFVHRDKMPDSRFLTQSDRFSFDELVRASTLPSFTTDLAKQYLGPAAGRVEVPITDPEASVTYHLLCRRDRARDFRALFAAVAV